MAENEKKEGQENNEEQEIIIERDDEKEKNKDEVENKEKKEKKETTKSKKKYKKKKILPIALIAVLTIIILLLMSVLFFIFKKKREKEINVIPQNKIEEITKNLKKNNNIQENTIDEFIKKANILFAKGQHEKALNLLDKLSAYSEALSNYNLGVIQIKEKNYEKAIEYFNKAILNKDNSCISAIDAAYCALKLGDKKRFDYYAHLAEIYLPQISDSKSYPYYYALVHYYLGEEFEALAGLEKSKTYPKQTDKLKSIIYSFYDDPYDAISVTKDDFTLGVLYAQIGEYQLAKQHLKKALEKNRKKKFMDSMKIKEALALVELKLGECKDASVYLNEAKEKEKIYYPIKVTLKPELFDIKVAQEKFKKEPFSLDDWISILFYYAPYKVFDVSQTIEFLQKGSFGIALDDISGANKYLEKSSTISKLNLEMSKGIKEALSYHILLANEIFAKLDEKYKHHSILQYDLALTYANLKDYKDAYIHFLNAYHLDSTNYLAGIFAIITGKKINVKKKYLDIVLSQLNTDIDFTDNKNLKYKALINLIKNDFGSALEFVESNPKNTKFNLALQLATLYELGEKNFFVQKATALKTIAPRDVIANLIYFYATHDTKDMKQFAMDFQKTFGISLKKWNMNSVYYGPTIASELYMKFAKMAGKLEELKHILQTQILSTNKDLAPLLKNLAFVELFTNNKEESYALFNDLIDNKHQNDSKTLFYGAVASIASGHKANAIALLALAKAKDKTNFEARYGLGLLYHEKKDLRGATIQYSKIPDNFKSEFFDFQIDNKATRGE